MDVNFAKKQYRTVGIVAFVIAVALLVMRIVAYYVNVAFIDSTMDDAWLELLIDAIFSVPVQIGVFLVFPFLMYQLSLKKSVRGVLAFSGYHKCNVWTCVLSVFLGFTIIFVTMFVSYIWQIILALFGFFPSGGGTLPETFNAGYFLLMVLLTAVLPAVCEEFANRGGLLTVMRSSFGKGKTILFIAIAFGLFHQNITQVFYTALLGGLLAFLVLETGSVFPAIIIHFMNNFMSVYLDSATTYGWKMGGGLYEFINGGGWLAVGGAIALSLLAAFGLIVAIVAIARKSRQKDLYLELNTALKESGYKVELKDNIFFIGAIVVSASSTLLTYIFGL